MLVNYCCSIVDRPPALPFVLNIEVLVKLVALLCADQERRRDLIAGHHSADKLLRAALARIYNIEAHHLDGGFTPVKYGTHFCVFDQASSFAYLFFYPNFCFSLFDFQVEYLNLCCVF